MLQKNSKHCAERNVNYPCFQLCFKLLSPGWGWIKKFKKRHIWIPGTFIILVVSFLKSFQNLNIKNNIFKTDFDIFFLSFNNCRSRSFKINREHCVSWPFLWTKHVAMKMGVILSFISNEAISFLYLHANKIKYQISPFHLKNKIVITGILLLQPAGLSQSDSFSLHIGWCVSYLFSVDSDTAGTERVWFYSYYLFYLFYSHYIFTFLFSLDWSGLNPGFYFYLPTLFALSLIYHRLLLYWIRRIF